MTIVFVFFFCLFINALNIFYIVINTVDYSLVSLSSIDKRLSDLKEFNSSFDAVAEWLNTTTTTVQRLASSVPSNANDARGLLDACHTCLEELSQKRHDLDCLSAMAHALHHGEMSSVDTVCELNSRYSLTTKKLNVRKCSCLGFKAFIL